MNFKRMLAVIVFSAISVSAATIGWVAKVQTSPGADTYRYTTPVADYSLFNSTVIQPLFDYDTYWARLGLFQYEIYWTTFDCGCTTYPLMAGGVTDPVTTPEPAARSLIIVFLLFGGAYYLLRRMWKN